jgi:ATP-dependent RNA helicase DeaD
LQYHIPETTDSYTHRSGRTSRVGNAGISLTFVFPEEKEKMNKIEQELGLKIERLPLPSMKDQLVNKAILWAKKIAIEKPISPEKLDHATKQEFKNALNHMTKDEILEKLLATYLREQQGN